MCAVSLLSFVEYLSLFFLDAGETHSVSMMGLRGQTSVDEDLEEALHSPRVSTVQAAMEHALKAHEGEYDRALFKNVKNW